MTVISEILNFLSKKKRYFFISKTKKALFFSKYILIDFSKKSIFEDGKKTESPDSKSFCHLKMTKFNFTFKFFFSLFQQSILDVSSMQKQ